MPIYEYGCQKCGKTFEFMQSMSEPRKTKCPECKGKLERLISSTAFVLKGGGWYKDLYASAKPGASGGDGESAGASASSEAAPSEAKSETKSETKVDAKPAKTETKTVSKTASKSVAKAKSPAKKGKGKA